ncbi:MAG TPA: ribulose-phosphate 3-epimerase [Clostridia bacterium]|nr:ribulose-phosphate 3-epimerase [Clostridia bacterium]
MGNEKVRIVSEIKVAPSLLAADFGSLREEAQKAQAAGADLLHLDVMDGRFVPEITFGCKMVRAIRQVVRIPLDVHLMVEAPETKVDSFVDAGADILTVHVEAASHLHRVLSRIKEKGILAGVAYNPATPIVGVENILDVLDVLLIMTVNPGYGGQAFIHGMLDKIETASTILSKKHSGVMVEVDGGITEKVVAEVVRAGAQILVAGSSVFGASDLASAIASLKAASTLRRL